MKPTSMPSTRSTMTRGFAERIVQVREKFKNSKDEKEREKECAVHSAYHVLFNVVFQMISG